MTSDKERENLIQMLVGSLQTTPFSVEFKVKKRPAGIKIIYEVTQEYMDSMVNAAHAAAQNKKQ